jgi:putative transposase
MSHVRTSPYYPQSNGKIERYHRTIKSETIRFNSPESLDDARKIVSEFVENYNNRRLHSAIGYITPKDKLKGREKEIFKGRDEKLDAARENRRLKRQEARMNKAVA